MIDFQHVEPPVIEVVVATDATRNGVSKTNNDVYVEGGLRVEQGPFYVGLTASNADYLIGADAETTVYAGLTKDFAGLNLDASVGYTKLHGVEYDGIADEALSVTASASKEFGALTASASVTYSNRDIYFDEASTYVEGGLGYSWGKNTVSGGVGRFATQDVSWNTYNVGYTRDLTDKVAVDVRYYGTDKDDSVGGPFGERTVASLKVKF